MTTLVVHEPAAFREALEAARRKGQRVGLVPTMGALHEGHLTLVDEAKRRADFTALTVFVNPLQFGPKEDFSRYPRTLPDDVAACTARGVELVFAPDREAMYPPGFQTHVEVEQTTTPLEGVFRPTHFRGVTTVVAKLFGLSGPCVAVFGRKDYQQWRVIDRMVRDLDMPIEVVGHRTIREADGLALSSRNRYLDASQREKALAIVRGLRAAWDAFEAGERGARALEALARAPVEGVFDGIDYVAVADSDSLAAIDGDTGARAVLAVAAHLGATRLIDNVVLGEEPRP